MPTAYQYVVGYVESLSAFGAVEQSARSAGVRCLAVKLHDQDGNPAADENRARLAANDRAELKRLRALGFIVGGWYCPRSEPERAAVDCSLLHASLHLGFALFETEAEYKSDGGGIDVGRLWDAWRRLRPTAVTGAAVQGNLPETYNLAATVSAKVHLLPETYWRQDGSYEPSACVAKAQALGLPFSLLHLTITGVEGHELRESLIRCYAARLGPTTGAFALLGCGLWRADQLTPADYAYLALQRGLALR